MVRLAHAGTLFVAPATAITAQDNMLVYDKITDQPCIAETCVSKLKLEIHLVPQQSYPHIRLDIYQLAKISQPVSF